MVRLGGGAVSGAAPTAVSGPAGSLTPFGFAVYRDGTAVITLAHTNQDGLFRDGAFTAVIDAAGQLAPCWMTRAGKYVFSANTASRTLSRLIGTGSNVFVDKAVAASISTGSPTDIDSRRAGRHRSPRRAVAPFGVRAGCLRRSDARRRSDRSSDPECERDRADGAPPGLDRRPPNEGCDRATARLCHAVAAFDRHGGRRLIERARAMEAIIGRDDFDADTAERYGSNRSIPDADLDTFVERFATRVVSVDRRLIAAANRDHQRAEVHG